MTFTCFSYVCLSFLKLRWLDETSFCPWVRYCHYCFAFFTVSSSSPLALAFDVRLAGLILIVAALVDLAFGLTLIVATSELLLVFLICWVVFIKTIIYLIIYFVLISVYTDSFTIFRLVFCQNLCKIIDNVCLFLCKFLKNVKKYVVNRFPSKPWQDYLFCLKELQVNFIGFFFRVLIRHCCNKFRKLIAKYSNDSKDHKGCKSKGILPFSSVMLSSRKS